MVVGGVGKPELSEDALHVLLDGVLGHEEALRDSSVRASLRHRAEYLPLALAELFEWVAPFSRPLDQLRHEVGSSTEPPSRTRRAAPH
jgi:hypothetical protein